MSLNERILRQKIEVYFRFIIFKIKAINHKISVLNAKVFLPSSRPFENYTNGILYKCSDLTKSSYATRVSPHPKFPINLEYQLVKGILIFKREFIKKLAVFDDWREVDLKNQCMYKTSDGSIYIYVK